MRELVEQVAQETTEQQQMAAGVMGLNTMLQQLEATVAEMQTQLEQERQHLHTERLLRDQQEQALRDHLTSILQDHLVVVEQQWQQRWLDREKDDALLRSAFTAEQEQRQQLVALVKHLRRQLNRPPFRRRPAIVSRTTRG